MARGGGYSVCKRVPTAVVLLWSGGCHDARWLIIIFYDRGAVRVFASDIMYQITFVSIQIFFFFFHSNFFLKPFKTIMWLNMIYNRENSPLKVTQHAV